MSIVNQLTAGGKKLMMALLPNFLKKKILITAIVKGPPLPVEDIKEGRAAFSSLLEAVPHKAFSGLIRDTIAQTSQRKTPLRIYTPKGDGPFPVMVYMHGGGFCLGDLETSDRFCRRLAKEAKCVLVSVDYGLAPEYKFPSSLEECYQVVGWVRQNSNDLNVDPDQLVIAGDSAGANLATALCLLARERKEFKPLFQVLICPPLDLDKDHAIKTKDMEQEILLTTDVCRQFGIYYVNDANENKNPLVSPVYAEDLSGLPPALVITAELDPLLQEDLKYVELLDKAGVKTIHQHYKGSVHDFVLFAGIVNEGDEAAKFISHALAEVF